MFVFELVLGVGLGSIACWLLCVFGFVHLVGDLVVLVFGGFVAFIVVGMLFVVGLIGFLDFPLGWLGFLGLGGCGVSRLVQLPCGLTVLCL